MASTNPGGDGNASNPQARQFALRQLYIKDVSFESPNTPGIFSAGAIEPEVKMNLQSGNKQVGPDAWEVVLHIEVHATAQEKSLFLVEIDQAGLFQLSGYTPEETQLILGTHCPATLFPYARELISSLVGRGGFPTLLLQPINFDAVYAQSQQARAKGAAAS